MAKKEKKISFRYFLNKALKGKEQEDNSIAYPLYVQVTYDKRNNKLKCLYYDDPIYWTDKDFYDFLEGNYSNEKTRVESKYISDTENEIVNIIRSEERKNDNFSLKGFATLFSYYRTPWVDLVGRALKVELMQEAENFLLVKQYKKVFGSDTPFFPNLVSSFIDKFRDALPQRLLSFCDGFSEFRGFIHTHSSARNYIPSDLFPHLSHSQIIEHRANINKWVNEKYRVDYIKYLEGIQTINDESDILQNRYTVNNIKNIVDMFDNEIEKARPKI